MKQTNRKWQTIVRKVSSKVKKRFDEIFHALDFGVYFEPEDYFVSYIFETTAQLQQARESGLLDKINQYHKHCLSANGYPKNGIKDCDFASQEDCEKQYGGNWFYYYK